MQVIALLALFFGYSAQMFATNQPFAQVVSGIVCGVVAGACGTASARVSRGPRWTGWTIAALGLVLGVWCSIMSPTTFRQQERINNRIREHREKMHSQNPTPDKSPVPTAIGAGRSAVVLQDPIDRLMVRVEHEAVPSYLFVPIKLPETASPGQCISVLTNRGDLHIQKILEMRQAHTAYENFTAVRLNSDSGEKIVLLHPMGTNGWYFRIYDSK